MESQKESYAVVPHCERKQPTGRGYVVREMRNGEFVDQYNYGGITPTSVAVRIKTAERRCAQLNGVAR